MPPGTQDIIPYTKELPKDTVTAKAKQSKPKPDGGAPAGGGEARDAVCGQRGGQDEGQPEGVSGLPVHKIFTDA